MKNIFPYAVLSVLVLCLMFSQTLTGQTTFQSQIFATDGTTEGTVFWGLDPLATNNVDSTVLPERELPPLGPTGVFDLRFINTPDLSTDLGQGVVYDFRGTVSATQIDTFVLSCKNGSPTSEITISWPSDLIPVCGTLRMVDGSTGGLIVNVNMLHTFSLTLPIGAGFDPPYELYIIRTEVKPVLVVFPTALNFGTVFLGAPASKALTFDNTTGTGDLVISSLTAPDPTYTFDKTTPWMIPAGTSDVLTVTFEPAVTGTVSGNIEVVHNADDWTASIAVTAFGGDPGMYRTFRHDELVSLDPLKLKLHKATSFKKPNKLEYELEFIVPTHVPLYTTLHLELGGASLGNSWQSELIPAQVVKKNDVVQVLGVDYNLTGATDGKNKKFDYVFTSLTPGDVINIHGYAAAKKPIKAKYWWLPIDLVAKEKLIKNAILQTDSKWKLNMPRLLMPNYGNVAADIFPGVKAGGSGIVLGTPDLPVGSRPEYPKVIPGWLKLYDYKSMQKTLRGKTDIQKGTPRFFDFYAGGIKPVAKQNKSLPPEKHDNVLMANLIALKFNIISSQQQNTPAGFGELTYYNLGNVLHGMTLGEIAALADPKMTTFDAAFDYNNLNTVLNDVNGAFSGNIDTVPGGFSGGKLILTGVKTLSEVPFLRRGTLQAVTVPTPMAPEIPEVFVLEQNYPNPFNPTTTIEFNLPEDAIVTLKVYNALGQEVATLIDREEMAYGLESVTFDANQISSGIYFYRLVAKGVETGATTQIMKKMVLMK